MTLIKTSRNARSIVQIGFFTLFSMMLLLSFAACESGLPQKEGSTNQETNTQTETQPTESTTEPLSEPAQEPPSDAGSEALPETAVETQPETTPNPALDRLAQDIAKNVCGALFRCCNNDHINQYFLFYRENRLLESFKPRLPPVATLTQETCTTVLQEMIVIVPFGDWINAAKVGKVQFDAAAAQTCLQTLQNAACGEAVSNALFDSTCFGATAPVGGTEQRKAFARTSSAGQECTILRDGVGAGFFGTCDPTQNFCCYPNTQGTTDPCGYPKEGVKGVCKKASAVNEACAVAPTVQLCKTGLDCGDNNRCEAPNTTPLKVGDSCSTERFQPLGECQSSWCDLTGTRKCTAFKEDGAACGFGSECKSKGCENKLCAKPTYCTGR